ncbi:MAG: hypothetical protein QM578_00060 [Pantoea sp.]|uniref:hypothetical protein n=1 Tax=Pantoea sp. TaxID=69393 RepID=UPI0039E3CC9D
MPYFPAFLKCRHLLCLAQGSQSHRLKVNMKIILILCVCLGLAGCSSYQRVSIRHDDGAPSAQWELHPALTEGDHLYYALKNGSKGEMRLRAVTDDTLYGQEGEHVHIAQITALERQELSEGKTAAAAGAGVGVAAVVVVAVVAAGLATALIAAGG